MLAFREEASHNERAIAHVIEAHFKAKQHFSQHFEDSTYRMSSRLGVPAKNVNSLFQGLVLPSYQNNLRLLSGQSPELLESARKLTKILLKSDKVGQEVLLKSIIDDSFLLKVQL